MNKQVEHLYIHIPFCKHICSYCDFVRSVPKCACEVSDYLNKLVVSINNECKFLKFKTIYIGGGTPNSFNNVQLTFLLSSLYKHLAKSYEFTIECNPEFITQEQINIFKKFKVNRISLGVQSRNNNILKDFNRMHTNADVDKAVKLLQKNKINNISVDFIYGYHKMTNSDIDKDIKFILDNHIPHASFYSLELKPGSKLSKANYNLNEELIDKQFAYIIKKFKNNKYKRYEISNWCINKNYQSQHNMAYWKTKPWKAFGYG
ncbi:MAG: radical SAM protein, partial [Malacoplasma sp.]|nr:radical SAM protein [Malacoplasma sp.]